MSAKLQGKNVLVITANTGIERDELLEPLKTLKQQAPRSPTRPSRAAKRRPGCTTARRT